MSSNCTTAIVDRRRDSNPQGLSTTEPYVLRIGSQLSMGGDEAIGSLKSEARSLKRAFSPVFHTSLFSIQTSKHGFRTGSRRVLRLNEVVVESFRSVRFRLSPIVDWHLCLRETPVTFTSRSPDIATLGSSYVDPNGSSSIVGLRRIDEVTAQMVHISNM